MNTQRVPEWLLERLAAGELNKQDTQTLKERLRQTGEMHRLQALEESNRQILTSLPPEQVVPEIKRRLRSTASKRQRQKARWGIGFLAVCTASLGAILLIRAGTLPSSSILLPPETVGLKGEANPQLRIYRKKNVGPEILLPQTSLHAGDVLQIRYLSAGRRYGVIASIDARGTVTLHLPEREGAAPALEHEGEKALPHSYELDDSPGFERFVFLTSESPFPTTLVKDLLTNKAPLPASMFTYEVTFPKESP